MITAITGWFISSFAGIPFIRNWMVLCAGVVIAAAVILIIVLTGRKKRSKSQPPKTVMEIPGTSEPVIKPEIEVANLQGIGDREEQQDAFGMSRLDDYQSLGFTAILCDGMGGMADGARLANSAVSRMLETMNNILKVTGTGNYKLSENISNLIKGMSGNIFRQMYGRGGTTLVMTYLHDGKLQFWCVGDSDLFLQRNGRLYAVNERQEYQAELLRKSLEGMISTDMAFSDPQSASLTDYIGAEEIKVEYNREPLNLVRGDVLFLCSDGISDLLTLMEIENTLKEEPFFAAELFEQMIIAKAVPAQDNFTGIIIRYNGKPGEDEA